jgi:hypothetical protein
LPGQAAPATGAVSVRLPSKDEGRRAGVSRASGRWPCEYRPRRRGPPQL